MAAAVSDRITGEVTSPTPRRRRIWPAVVALIACVALLATFVALDSGGPSSSSTEHEFLYNDGSNGSLDDFRGEPVVLHFFASWAMPERPYLPIYDDLYQVAEGRLQVVGVNHDLTEADWLAFIEGAQLDHPTVFQPGQEIFEEAGGLGLPATLFVSSDGEVVHLSTGLLTADQLSDLVAEHLGIEL